MSEPAVTWLVGGGAVEVCVEQPELVAVVGELLGAPSPPAPSPAARVRIRRGEPWPWAAAAMAAAPDGVHPVRVAGEQAPTWCTNRACFAVSGEVECVIASPDSRPGGLGTPGAGGAPSDRHPERFYYRYLSFALQLGMWRAGFLYLHAATLVGGDRGAVMIAGPSGSGKSTLCVALIEAGWSVLSDDSVYAAVTGDQLIALPRPMHLDPRLARTFPRLQPLVGREPYLEGRSKVGAHAAELYPDRVVSSAPFPTTIVLPSIRGVDTSRAVHASRERARAELERNALAMAEGRPWFPDARASVLERLASGADCIELVAGRDAALDPRLLVGLITQARPR